MSRIATVIKMQFVNKWTFIWIPLIILGGAFAVSLALYAIIPVEGPKFGGGAQAPMWYALSAGIMSMAATFPFSQAMSITRREFYVGTLSAAAILAFVLAIVFVVGGMIEGATNGWGINGYFFRLTWLWEQSAFIAGLFYFTVTMLLFTIGFFFATIYRRWGASALTIGLVAFSLIVVAAVAIITKLEAWSSVMQFVMNAGVTGLTFTLLGLTVAFAVAAYLPLRRATP